MSGIGVNVCENVWNCVESCVSVWNRMWTFGIVWTCV